MLLKKISGYFIIAFIFLISCKKEALTKPVHFTSTTYDTLGNFDTTAKPNNLLPRDVISSGLVSFIETLLPEGHDLRKTHPELLASKAIADLPITVKSDVFITFLSEGTIFKNTFAVYTYPTDKPPTSTADIKIITCVFPNAGRSTPLIPGDKVFLGNYEPGTSIGFLILRDAWNPITHSINFDAVHLCSDDFLNQEVDPNLKKHAILINYVPENKVLIGFEDLDRTDPSCDNDFNDILIYCTLVAH